MGLLDEFGAWLDNKRRVIASNAKDYARSPGLLADSLGQDFREWDAVNKSADGKWRSVVPEVRAEGWKEGVDNWKGVAGLLGAIKGAKLITEFDRAHQIAQKNAALPVEKGGLGLPPDNTAMDRAKAMGYTFNVVHGGGPDLVTVKDFATRGQNKGLFTTDPSISDHATANSYAIGGGHGLQGLSDQQISRKLADGEIKALEGGAVYPLLTNKDRLLNLDSITWDQYVNSVGKKKAYKHAEQFAPDAWDTAISSGGTKRDLANALDDLFPYSHSMEIWNGPEFDALSSVRPPGKFAATVGASDEIAKSQKKTGGVTYQDAESGEPAYVLLPGNVRSRFAAFDPKKKNSGDILASLGLLGMFGSGSYLNNEY